MTERVEPVALAEQIVRARVQGLLLPAPADHGLGPAEAYAIQGAVLAPRMARGGGRGGWKLGYTSAVMRSQMGIAEPNYGPLAHAMILADGAVISEGVTQPRVEPEIAAVLGRDLPRGSSIDLVWSAVAEWRIAVEVVDSVWEDYRFDWALNTADGSSAAFVVLGEVIAWARDDDLPSLDVDLVIDGSVVGSGSADAAMGDPAVAVHWLVQREALVAGDVVITGGLTAAVPLQAGSTAGAFARRGGEILGAVSAMRTLGAAPVTR